MAFAIFLSSVLLVLGFVTAARTTYDAPRPTPNDYEPDTGIPEGETLSAATSAQDVAGKPVSGLSRYPGSVRTAYSERREDGLSIVRVGYLTRKSPEAVRDFYAGVFRAEGWGLANVEYTGGEWYFLAVRGGREAVVEVASRGGGSRVWVEVTRPLAGSQGEESASAGGSKR